jgi:hypothetical protein
MYVCMYVCVYKVYQIKSRGLTQLAATTISRTLLVIQRAMQVPGSIPTRLGEPCLRHPLYIGYHPWNGGKCMGVS